jgi:hypothetical protein
MLAERLDHALGIAQDPEPQIGPGYQAQGRYPAHRHATDRCRFALASRAALPQGRWTPTKADR